MEEMKNSLSVCQSYVDSYMRRDMTRSLFWMKFNKFVRLSALDPNTCMRDEKTNVVCPFVGLWSQDEG